MGYVSAQRFPLVCERDPTIPKCALSDETKKEGRGHELGRVPTL